MSRGRNISNIMAMVVNSISSCALFHSLIARSKKVQRFNLLHTINIRTQERCQHQSKNARFCVLSYDQYMTLYIREFLRNADGVSSLSVKHRWSFGPSSRIESSFLPDSFSNVYSDGGNHTRVFVVSYAHGHILSPA